MSDYKYKLSIITINYNNKKGLEDTFKSVFEQTWQEFEYIVIDGGSTDGSREVIEKHSDKIDYWVSEKDKGIYNALNKGIVKANGEYILCLNSGDLLFEEVTLEKVHSYFDSGDDLIYGDSLIFNDAARDDYIRFSPLILNFNFFVTNGLIHQSLFIKKQLHDRVGLYNENLRIVSDWEFLLKVSMKNKAKKRKINIIISKYDKTGISSSRKDILYFEKKDVLLKNFFLKYILYKLLMKSKSLFKI